MIKDALRNVKDYRKADSIDTFKILVGEGLFTDQGEIYDQQERVIKSAFGKKYFSEFRKIIDDEMTNYIDGRLYRSKREGGCSSRSCQVAWLRARPCCI